MGKTRHHRSKSPNRKAKKDKHEPEVFVLPPDLLKKLGISIGHPSQQSAEVCEPGIQNGTSETSASNFSTLLDNSSSESSFLETATLMKKSVFLSPTFIPTVTNVNSGEIEITEDSYSGKANIDGSIQEIHMNVVDNSDAKLNDVINMDICMDVVENVKLMTSDLNNAAQVISNDYSNLPLQESEFTSDNSLNGFIGSVENINTPLTNGQTTSSTVCAYISDNLCDNTQNSKVINSEAICPEFVQVSAPKISNKINIISEEIIPLSKLKNFKHSVPNLTAVTVDTFITVKNISNNNTLTNSSSKIDDNKLNFQNVGMNMAVPNYIADGRDKLTIENKSVTNITSPAKVKLVDTIIPVVNVNCDSLNINNNILTINDCHGKGTQELAYNAELETFDAPIESSTNFKKMSDSSSEQSTYTLESSIQQKNQLNFDTSSVINCKDNKETSKEVNNSNILAIQENQESKDNNLQNIAINDTVLNKSKDINENSHLEKVKELSAYIQQVYKSKKKTNKNKRSKKAINEKIEKCKLTPNSNKTKSKVYVEGVEKPGGNLTKKDMDNSKVLKTYYRQKRNDKKCLVLNNIANISLETTPSLASIEYIETSNSDDCTLTQVYCLCYDFGRLELYADINVYEHIHFWKHNKTICEKEVIFSIYNEVKPENEIELNDDLNYEKHVEDNVAKICWNNDAMFNDNPCKIKNVETLSKDVSTCLEEEKTYTNTVTDEVEDVTVNAENNESQSDVSKSEEIQEVVETPSAAAVQAEVHNNIDSANLMKNVIEDTDTDKVKTVTTIKKHSENYNEKNKQVQVASPNKTGTFCQQTNQGYLENEKPNTVEWMCSPTSDHLIPPAKTKVTQLKRIPSRPQSLDVIEDGPPPKKNIRCGVCDKLFTNTDWTEHVINDHYHIAWKAGESLDIDDPEFIKEVKKRLKSGLYLICSICNKMQTRHINKFLTHVRKCLLTLEELEEISTPPTSKPRKSTNSSSSHECGVCRQDVPILDWNKHIGKEHNYLAWINGTTALDVNNESAVKDHLTRMARGCDGLTCFKCGLKRKRAQVYLDHIKTCNGEKIVDCSIVDKNSVADATEGEKSITCGVCNESITVANWATHIGKEHQYLAWEKGSEPLKLDDTEAVHNHLLEIIRHSKGLMCYKCGIIRRRVKVFLTHIETCDGEGVEIVDDDFDDSIDLDSTQMEHKRRRSSIKSDKVICGVCNKNMPECDWIDHIGTTHNYQAWREGETPLNKDDNDMVLKHLTEILEQCKYLTCHKCGFQRKKARLYLAHIAKCMNDNLEAEDSKLVTCGVCKEEVMIGKWIEHIKTEHNYVAWQEGSTPLDLDDECAVRAHLNNVSREIDGLVCSICGVVKKYPKSFLDHIQECNNSQEISNEMENFATVLDAKIVTCGVCKKEVESCVWFEHIKNEHNYIAWVEGQEVINENDPDMVYKHLIGVSKLGGGLSCPKCGAKRKIVKSYMQHIETCDGPITANEDMVKCAVCEEELRRKDWRSHAINNHYNVAWIVGDCPIELNSPYVVEPYIREYLRLKRKLVCRICGVSRVSNVGFYAHVIQCGKSEEEMEMYKETCVICNSKYLKIYKSQHMTAHKEAEFALERRLLMAKEKQMKKEELEARRQADLNVSGSRRAAEKAKCVIEKYRKSNKAEKYSCNKCKFNTNIESELKKHVCVDNSDSESDESVDFEHCSTDLDSGDSDIDSDVSDQEREQFECGGKRKSNDQGSSASKIQRMPYIVQNESAYIKQSAEEFRSTHLSDEDLFPQWRKLDYEILSENDLKKYTPPIEKSCKVKFKNSDWNTFDRFESRREETKQGHVTATFAGAYIQCMSWVPAAVGAVGAAAQRQHVAAACHPAPDAPRYSPHDTRRSPALLQIWDCQEKFTTLKFVLGIALDFGAVWAMDWCPSGARDSFDSSQIDSKKLRLGLLAIACSNGSAYVLSIPYPTESDDMNQTYCRLKPVAELRFQMSSNKKKCQASAIKWSPEKGHSNIVVGYSDGTVAYYNVTGESPLLKYVEDGVTIFYPYNEERPLNASIEEVDVYPSAEGCAVCAGSVGGARLRARGGAVPAHVPSPRARFAPHWPSALLAGDDALVWQSVNEIEWWGGGRRLGGARAFSCCAWCARVCYSTPPLLRVTRIHPVTEQFNKLVVATMQMLPLVERRERKENDESMTMEPLTYEEAIQKYGIVFNQITGKDKMSQRKCTTLPKEVYPDRFPLAEVADLLFCPTAAHHNKLLIGLRSGLMILMSL